MSRSGSTGTKPPTHAGPRRMSRGTRIATLVPLAALSAAWTFSLVGGSTATATADKDRTHLPDGTALPTQTVQAPASVPVTGSIAPSVPDGDADQVVASASSGSIPAPALTAYQRAAQIIDAADKSCNIPWELIAAIGRVESDHGQYGGSTLNAKGIDVPGIYGPVLDGKDGTQAIHDTDDGVLDHDAVWDRAVGPMQFIPSTWQVVKVDADGDGKRNPQDINDASLATAVYLCSGKGNLSTRTGQEAAVYRYNHSHSYVDLVLRIMEAYSQGDYTTTPAGSYSGSSVYPDYTLPAGGGGHAKKHRSTAQHGASGGTSTTTGTKSTGSGSTGSKGSGSGGSGSNGSGGSGSTPPVTVPTTVPTQITQPVTKTLNQLGETTSFCTSQLKAAGLTGDALTQAVPACVSKVGDMTKAEATDVIPTGVKGILQWLGLCTGLLKLLC